MKTLSCVFAILMGACVAASAEDGNQILRRCAGASSYGEGKGLSGNDIDTGYCAGLVAGFTAGIQIGQSPTHPRVCLPDGYTTGQGIQVFVKYLREHPEQLHEEEGFLLFYALGFAFPCKAPGKPKGGGR